MHSNQVTRCVYVLLTAVIAPAAALRAAGDAEPPVLRPGVWRAWLESPGGDLPFELVFKEREADPENGRREYDAWIINGAERIAVPVVTVEAERVILDIDYYDSRIIAKTANGATELDGVWKKKGRGDTVTEMTFHAVAGRHPRFLPPVDRALSSDHRIDGRWIVHFSGDDAPAVGVFETKPDGTATGTFLTTTGDYRFLAGDYDGRRLRLSAFDGAHAFLFLAQRNVDGSLRGDFWSRDTWHETWTATRDPKVTLPDAFSQTKRKDTVDLSALVFPDVDGVRRSLADPALAGKARIIEVFGSWCPNCHDASNYLVELQRRYGDRGLSIVGLAFELTGDFERDARQVRIYGKRHGITYPVLIAGLADKATVSESFPLIDELRSYPTTVFLDGSGSVRAIHTGFSGPATGNAHRQLRARFESIIEELLSEAR